MSTEEMEFSVKFASRIHKIFWQIAQKFCENGKNSKTD